MVRSKIRRDVEGGIWKCFFKENKRLGGLCVGLSPRAAGVPLESFWWGIWSDLPIIFSFEHSLFFICGQHKLEHCEHNSDSHVFIKENPFMDRREKKKNQPKPSPSFSLYMFCFVLKLLDGNGMEDEKLRY
ncbi:hypothetical protein SLA2020_011430 [Shorea laevis]